jgi:hypothetical protein
MEGHGILSFRYIYLLLLLSGESLSKVSFIIIIIYSYCIELKAIAMGIFRVKAHNLHPISIPWLKPYFRSLNLISPLVRRTNKTFRCIYIYTLLIPSSIH